MASCPFAMRLDSFDGTAIGKTNAEVVVRPGDELRVIPGAEKYTVQTIETSDNGHVRLTFNGNVKLAVGDVVCSLNNPVEAADQFKCEIDWAGAEPLLVGRPYAFCFGEAVLSGSFTDLKQKWPTGDRNHPNPARTLRGGETGEASFAIDREIGFAPFEENSLLGAVSVKDSQSGEILGQGRIHFALRRASNVHRQKLAVERSERANLKRQRPCVLWFTGLSGSGKSAIANEVEAELTRRGHHTILLDGDNMRHGLNHDLGFTDADRVENIRRVAEVARLMTDAGLIVLCAFISPFTAERQLARTRMRDGEFYEIHIDTPLAICEERDEKGLYAKARAGQIKNFTGIDSPYEPPDEPDLSIDTTNQSAREAALKLINLLENNNHLR